MFKNFIAQVQLNLNVIQLKQPNGVNNFNKLEQI